MIQMQFKINVEFEAAKFSSQLLIVCLVNVPPKKARAETIVKMKFTQVKCRDATLKINFTS